MSIINKFKEQFPYLKNQIFESSKIWHNSYPCKIRFSRGVTPAEIWFWLGGRFASNFPFTNDKVRVRISRQIVVYFKHTIDVEEAIKHFNIRVISCYILPDEKSVDILAENSKLRLKKQLYFKKYYHKITFKYTAINDINDKKREELKKWVQHQFEIDNNIYFIRNDRVWFRWQQLQPTLFLRDDDDLTLVKLAWGEYFISIETIKLISELE